MIGKNDGNTVVDIAVLDTKLDNLIDAVKEMKKCNTVFTKQLNKQENAIIHIKSKQNNITIFQSILTVVGTGIATYLGINRQ